MNGRRLTRHDRVLLDAWSAELADVEDPADLCGGLDLDEVTRALARVAIGRTAAEADPGLAAVLVAALRANDLEYARLVGAVDGEIDPDDTEAAAVRRHLAGLLVRARDRGRWDAGRHGVHEWLRSGLGLGAAQRRAVDAVVAALDDTAGADPGLLGVVLDERDVPALLWLLAGLVALAGGDVAVLDRRWCDGTEGR